MTSMKSSIDLSIYAQNDTLIELLDKHSLVLRIMSMRAVLTKTRDSDEQVLLACQFSAPSMGSQQAEMLMHGLLLGRESVQGQLQAALLDYRPKILLAFHQALLSYLQDFAIYYRDPKNVHSDTQSDLSPQVNDFVCYRDGGKKTHFGIIDSILEQNLVSLRVIKYGKMTWQNTHSRTMKLLFRPSDERNFVNI